MGMSAVNADKSTKAEASKDGARVRTAVEDSRKMEIDPLRGLVQGKPCGASLESVAQKMAMMPRAQRREAALSMQRTRGNRFVQGMAVQAKLALGPVGDRYEQEADRVARRMVETISSPEQDSVQRQDGEDEDELDLEEGGALRRKVDVAGLAPTARGANVGPELESAIRRARGSGQPLSDGVRQPMERAFGADFGRVRVHTDGEADSLNRSIQARAFTTGQDVFLRQGEYRPGSSEGQRLLAHELTHVIQQTGAQKLQLSQNPPGNGHAQISKSSTVHIQRYYERINQADSVAVREYVIGLFGKWAGSLYPRRWRIRNSERLSNETAPERRDLVGSLYNAYFPSGPDFPAPPAPPVGGAGGPVAIPVGPSTSMAELTLEQARTHFGMTFADFKASDQGRTYKFYEHWKTKPGVPLPDLTEGSQGYWFNYFWKEAQSMTDQERVWVLEGWIENQNPWPVNYPIININTNDAEKLERMRLMVNKGMRKYGGDPLIHDLVGPGVLNQLAAGQEIRVGYRGEKWLTRATAETVGKLPQVGDPLRTAALHMNAPWHPYSVPDIAKDCLFRSVNADNCLYTLTSVAKEFKDATKFPFVQQMVLGDLQVVMNAGGNAIACTTMIRIFMVNASKMAIYDPTRLGAAQWAGGEFAVRVIKPGEFLAELEVTRLHPRETASAAPPIQTTDFSAECGHNYRVTAFTLMLGATINPVIERLVVAKIAELQIPQTYDNVADNKTGNIAGIAF